MLWILANKNNVISDNTKIAFYFWPKIMVCIISLSSVNGEEYLIVCR